jgi:hypothetical protein
MKRIPAILFVVLMCAITCGDVWGQATAQISGTVRDQSGAVLPGVEITATQTDTAASRSIVTNETGSYVMPNLPLGPYRLEASLPGFRTFAQTGIVLQVNSSSVINVTLEVGQVSEQIEVQANASLVETRSVGVGRIMETERIVELPLNGRNAQELLLLTGGATQVTSCCAEAFPGRLLISSAGALGPGTDYSLDGMRHLDPWDGQGMTLPFPDALAEFKTEASGLTAQQARSSTVGAVTKSGTNAFHGDLFEFVRNDLFNARNYFATKGSTLKRNQFGGTLGGPLLKNKLFFFAGYQGTTVRQDPADTRAFVPTAAMLAGDFTAFASPPCTTRATALRSPFNDNRIDPALFSPAALKLTALLPKTNDPCGQFFYGQRNNSNNSQVVGRIDYQLSEKHSLFGRFMRSYNENITPFKYTPDIVLTAINGTEAFAHAHTLGSTYLINPTTVNSFRISYSGDNLIRHAQEYFGYDAIGVNVRGKYPKIISVNVTSGFSVSGSNPGGFRTNFYQLADDVTMTRGTHQFGFGVHLAHARSIGISTNTSQGVFNFTGGTTGLGLADFLIGKVGDFNQGENQETYSRQNFRGVYGQDTWQATRRVTVNYGVRWAPVLPIQDLRRPVPMLMNFDINRYRQGLRSTVFVNSPPGFLYAGDPGFVQNNNGASAEKPKADINKAYWFKFAPRLGLAWDVQGNGRTSVRASYGLNYEDPYGVSRLGSQSGMGPWGMFIRVIAPVGGFDDPWRGVQGGNPFPVTLSRNTPFGPLGDYLVAPGNLVPTYTQSFNLSVQRELTPGTLVSASYLGTLITHIQAADPLNQAVFVPGNGDANGNCFLQGSAVYFKVAPGAVCSSIGNTQGRRKLALENPAFAQEIGRMSQITYGGTQNYHGLLLSVQRRPSRGLNVNANYTWSHCIGDYGARANSGYGTNITHTYLDPTNRRRDRANCESDQRQILNLTAVAETPKFGNRVLSSALSGWRLSGIYRASTSASSAAFRTVGLGDPPGSQVTTNGIDRCLCDLSGQRPDLVLNDIYKDKTGGPMTQYLNPAAFAQPALGSIGTAGRGIVKLPYAWQFDVAVSRIFRFKESQSMEFRAEAYNVTNTFRPGDINLNLTSSQFGQIRTSLEPRVMQFALKYLF